MRKDQEDNNYDQDQNQIFNNKQDSNLRRFGRGAKRVGKGFWGFLSGFSRGVQVLIVGGLAIAIFCILYFGGRSIFEFFKPDTGAFITRVESSLEKLETTSNLTTIEYVYNGVAAVKNEKTDKVDFYVAYDGVVSAGIDFEDIQITADPEQDNRVIISVPNVEIQNTDVDIKSLDMIYVNPASHTETVVAEALDASHEQIQKAVRNDKTLLEVGKENATRTLQALLQPLLEQLDPKIEVVFE